MLENLPDEGDIAGRQRIAGDVDGLKREIIGNKSLLIVLDQFLNDVAADITL